MKRCQTCNKPLYNETDEYTYNGMLQCEECAKKIRNYDSKTDDSSKNKINSSIFWIVFFNVVSYIMLAVNISACVRFAKELYATNIVNEDIMVYIDIIGIVASIVIFGLSKIILNLAKDVYRIRKRVEKN